MVVKPSSFEAKDGEVVRDVTVVTTYILHFANGVDERYTDGDEVSVIEE